MMDLHVGKIKIHMILFSRTKRQQSTSEVTAQTSPPRSVAAEARTLNVDVQDAGSLMTAALWPVPNVAEHWCTRLETRQRIAPVLLAVASRSRKRQKFCRQNKTLHFGWMTWKQLPKVARFTQFHQQHWKNCLMKLWTGCLASTFLLAKFCKCCPQCAPPMPYTWQPLQRWCLVWSTLWEDLVTFESKLRKPPFGTFWSVSAMRLVAPKEPLAVCYMILSPSSSRRSFMQAWIWWRFTSRVRMCL